MRRVWVAAAAVIVLGGIYGVTRPAFFDTGAPLRATGQAIHLLDDLDTDDLGEGWRHRTFFRITPADYRIVQQGAERVL